jgi:hypothetical protein
LVTVPRLTCAGVQEGGAGFAVARQMSVPAAASNSAPSTYTNQLFFFVFFGGAGIAVYG